MLDPLSFDCAVRAVITPAPRLMQEKNKGSEGFECDAMRCDEVESLGFMCMDGRMYVLYCTSTGGRSGESASELAP